jgi:hypothetical protein
LSLDRGELTMPVTRFAASNPFGSAPAWVGCAKTRSASRPADAEAQIASESDFSTFAKGRDPKITR